MLLDEAQRWLSYDPESGVFSWVQSPGSRIKIGAPAGTINAKGYVIITIRGRLYRAHRLAVLMMTGAMPPEHVDHLNGDPADNRWANLREASNSENMQNQTAERKSRSGVLGVSWYAKNQRWRATIKHQGKAYWLGLYDTVEDAHTAYLAAKAQLHRFHPVPR